MTMALYHCISFAVMMNLYFSFHLSLFYLLLLLLLLTYHRHRGVARSNYKQIRIFIIYKYVASYSIFNCYNNRPST